ncbi:hypothetical protein QVD17_19934 [Tagetes erecta]|uniref:Uncharacterized protein n=1 Tax=Tagetes erecta TaxID=13708 RepID=A0AAD8KNZ1_TARER|nr:hypothetical protein QVD17_19934 [Tagetes erecta]
MFKIMKHKTKKNPIPFHGYSFELTNKIRVSKNTSASQLQTPFGSGYVEKMIESNRASERTIIWIHVCYAGERILSDCLLHSSVSSYAFLFPVLPLKKIIIATTTTSTIHRRTIILLIRVCPKSFYVCSLFFI